MLTKKLKFDNDVLEVLRNMEFSADGCLGVITGGQLERGLYERVNKALSAMGGKWNRKLGGHVFQVDPRPMVEGLLDTGSLQVERDGFFETPPAVIDGMFDLVPPVRMGLVLEPSAGMGAIVRKVIECGIIPMNIVCVEKNRDRALKLRDYTSEVFCCDFLVFETRANFLRVYMNPPFEEMQDIDHVMHAYDLLFGGGALVSVMSEGPFFRSGVKAEMFREWLKKVGGRSHRLPEGSFKESGTGVNTRLVSIWKQ